MAMTISENEDDVLKTIKFLRKEMIHSGIQEGLTSEKTLSISRKLDIYITKYQMIKKSSLLFYSRHRKANVTKR